MKLGWILVSAFAGSVLWTSHTHMTQRSVVRLDPHLSDACHDLIAASLLTTKKNPVVDEVLVRTMPLRCNEILVHAYPAIVRIGQELVLAKNGLFLPSSYYRPTYLSQIPEISVPSAKSYVDAPEQLRTFAAQLKPEYAAAYAITWCDESSVQWHSRSENFTVLTCGNQQPTEEQLSYIAAMSAGQHGCIDIRFAKQMVFRNV